MVTRRHGTGLILAEDGVSCSITLELNQTSLLVVQAIKGARIVSARFLADVKTRRTTATRDTTTILTCVCRACWSRVLEKDLPVAVEDIEDEFYRNHVVKSG